MYLLYDYLLEYNSQNKELEKHSAINKLIYCFFNIPSGIRLVSWLLNLLCLFMNQQAALETLIFDLLVPQ